MKPNVGSINVTLNSLVFAPVTLAEAYFGTAQALMPGATLLAEASPPSATALTFISAQILECILKAYLAKQGVTEKELRTLSHNLTELWIRGCVSGLPISPVAPDWAQCLNDLHDKPFYLRYPIGLNGLVLPATKPMYDGLKDLLDLVSRHIR